MSIRRRTQYVRMRLDVLRDLGLQPLLRITCSLGSEFLLCRMRLVHHFQCGSVGPLLLGHLGPQLCFSGTRLVCSSLCFGSM